MDKILDHQNKCYNFRPNPTDSPKFTKVDPIRLNPRVDPTRGRLYWKLTDTYTNQTLCPGRTNPSCCRQLYASKLTFNKIALKIKD